MLFRLPQAKRVIENPSAEAVKELAAKMPTARPTKYGNLNVQTQVLARSKRSTFLVTDEPDGQNQALSTDDATKWAERQDEYIAGREMVVIDGYIGNDSEFRTPTRLYVEATNANIAGMQQQLYFGPPEDDFEPELTVIYTPKLKADGFPDDRLIMVDLDQGVTRVFNSDYFGEAKKGGLRMWNKLVYDRGGLPLHAGCKIIPTQNGDKICLTVGLSGTGKTTTTFTRQNGSLPIQDDFVAWMPDGRIYVTENGCFAKTYGLNPDDEPTIYGAAPQAAAFFMLGETKGTAAGGADEAGKALRVPGTNPFFPMPHDLQGNRFLELLDEHPLQVFLLNTGRVGGPDEDERSKKVRIKHSSAIVKGIAEGTIEWERDPDFGYLVARSVPGIEDPLILQPRKLYEEQGRSDEYAALVGEFKAERAEFLGKFPSLSEEIVAAA